MEQIVNDWYWIQDNYISQLERDIFESKVIYDPETGEIENN